MARAGDGDARGIGLDFDDLLTLGKRSGHAGMNFDLATRRRIEGEMQLAGENLNDGYVARVADLLRSEFIGAISRPDAGEVDLGVNFVGLQLADDALGSAHANLRLGNGLGADL